MGYLPANSQITLAPDHVFSLAAWLYAWRRTRRRAAAPAATALAPRPAT